MYSLDGKIYFGRYNTSGSVRLLIFAEIPRFVPEINGIYPEAIVDKIIDDGHWCSAVAAVSIDGEKDGRYYRMSVFHNG
jgi:hypothetical protein